MAADCGEIYYEGVLHELPRGLIINTLEHPVDFHHKRGAIVDHTIVIPPSPGFNRVTHAKVAREFNHAYTIAEKTIIKSCQNPDVWFIVSRRLAVELVGKSNVLFSDNDFTSKQPYNTGLKFFYSPRYSHFQ